MGRANGQLDFVVGGPGPSIGEPVPRRSNNGVKVPLDLLAQITEHRDSAPLGTVHPFLEQGGNLVRAGFDRQTQIFLQKVGSVKSWVSLRQELQLCFCASEQFSGFSRAHNGYF